MSPKKSSVGKAKATKKDFRRIATEEAFSTPEQMDAMREILAQQTQYHPDLFLWKVQTDPNGPVNKNLLDLEDQRLKIMDHDGVDMHLLSLTSTGVQMMEAGRALDVAIAANDRLANVIQKHPARFTGLATVPPQDVPGAIKEAERAINQLKLNGLIVNSHTNGEYLSDKRYWPLLEAIAALKAALYIHPRAPIPAMAEAYHLDHLEHAIWGYQAETGLHALRLITSGVFDAIPNLKIVLGHMGEALPYWLYRIDYMHGTASIHFDRAKLKKKPSEYFKQNFAITTSGMNWHPVLKFCIEAVGADNIMWAIDYPYQTSPDAVKFMNAAPISDVDKHKIFHKNAERIFHIKPE
ncbi:MAG: amidohydrolase family protein [Candidatus Acidiferrales bacterium]